MQENLWLKYFEFLDALRESGEINMFGATPHLEAAFDLTKSDARKILTTWMERKHA